MNLHQHARLSPRGRALLVDRILVHGLRVEEAAHAAGVSVRTAYKWLRRFKEEGTAGLMDRSSRPRHCPHAIAQSIVDQVLEQRRCRQTYRQIAGQLPVAPSTIARLLRRAGLHRLAELEPALPHNRYEYAQPGQLLHLDIKKLARFRQPGHRVTDDRTVTSRGIGWEYVHLAIRRFRRLVRRLGLRHLRTRPYTPRTNGKAERLVQTSLREWAYARSYIDSTQRANAFPGWLHHYNWHRPHASLGYKPPISRIPLNNVVGLHN
ncbi:leucine zipper domain-containing protein [Xanthomonas sp. LF07-6]|uniref:leucine zipper domain-containing protein n=1 Tax=Xanthomonas sp. LF07-6 TaxID=3097550 RepID=UPI002A805104|nr:leucine zipper domain-containing protein [Xanthomonas sp. LF07-6]MDY4342207.1 leucine zipper domain-containing protein [Xanthomonas sp. LF07-6]